MSKVDRSVLVTGGAGYVGSHCAQALHAAGFGPVVFDNLSTGHRDFVKWGPLIEGDILDGDQLVSALRQYKPVAVMHFAALALVGESVRKPEDYWRVNTTGTLNILHGMQQTGVTNLVFSSTCAVYGSPEIVPIDEEAPKEPVNPYGASKLAAERMMDDFSVAHGIRSVKLRYFNACGAAPEQGLGEDRELETHLIPLILDAASGRGPTISMFGDDYPTPDGTAVRDYVHVRDLAAAHVSALAHLIGGGATMALNLGTGSGHSVAEVIAVAEAVTGIAITKTIAPRRVGDPSNLVADPRRARERLLWNAQSSDLRQIIGDAWLWHRSRFPQGRR